MLKEPTQYRACIAIHTSLIIQLLLLGGDSLCWLWRQRSSHYRYTCSFNLHVTHTNLLLSLILSVGPLCEYTENSGSEVIRQTCNTYDVYMSSLNFTCQPGQPGRLVWTPNDSTPDVMHYQVLNIIEYNIAGLMPISMETPTKLIKVKLNFSCPILLLQL